MWITEGRNSVEQFKDSDGYKLEYTTELNDYCASTEIKITFMILYRMYTCFK